MKYVERKGKILAVTRSPSFCDGRSRHVWSKEEAPMILSRSSNTSGLPHPRSKEEAPMILSRSSNTSGPPHPDGEIKGEWAGGTKTEPLPSCRGFPPPTLEPQCCTGKGVPQKSDKQKCSHDLGKTKLRAFEMQNISKKTESGK